MKGILNYIWVNLLGFIPIKFNSITIVGGISEIQIFPIHLDELS